MLPLRVYVSATCTVCKYTYELIERLRTIRPDYPVEVIDLDQDSSKRPAFVFGTPTYVVGETVIALGNPELSTLLAWLDHIARVSI
ncbi:MAG TPA: hypothetical protein DEF43_01215 [Chloroflexus aurantiacus]|uniref:Thioredoxin-like fold domain-containing protein n=1 Tax=Chloroflexus aurantiacus (strain ATCC 29366 / DSM 635 / J-10-fl) TaxID=324602 RepID=A9WEN4_CHLAA|nr:MULTISPECIES: hypothetical protein [Chloroflexus]ABY33793.1 hypothetical protein Caur_0547 [Chloroflexus aurantiacus J-10-fl]HBW65792.1 hypothetical protein [Chloroflexus aurantiacus]